MDQNKKDRLEGAGWRVGNAEDFLELSPEETAFVESSLPSPTSCVRCACSRGGRRRRRRSASGRADRDSPRWRRQTPPFPSICSSSRSWDSERPVSRLARLSLGRHRSASLRPPARSSLFAAPKCPKFLTRDKLQRPDLGDVQVWRFRITLIGEATRGLARCREEERIDRQMRRSEGHLLEWSGKRICASGSRQIRGCRVTLGGHQGQGPVDFFLTA